MAKPPVKQAKAVLLKLKAYIVNGMDIMGSSEVRYNDEAGWADLFAGGSLLNTGHLLLFTHLRAQGVKGGYVVEKKKIQDQTAGTTGLQL